MGRLISVCNQKGGVGKTTTAINLSSALAISGLKILLIDLDPQANATGGLGVDKRQVTRSIYEAVLEGIPLRSVVLKTPVPNLSLVPSHVSLSGAEVELVGLAQREERLRAAVVPIKEAYDLILIDCPPSLGLLTVNALTAADAVLIPLQCEYYALEGLSQLLETVRLVQNHLNPALTVEGVLLTMADFRTKLTSDVIQEVRRFFGPKVYEIVIPRSVRLSEAPSRGLPIGLYDPDSIGARAYQQLAQQLKEKLNESTQRIRPRDSGPDTRGEPDPSRREAGVEAGEGNPAPAPINPPQSIPAQTGSG